MIPKLTTVEDLIKYLSNQKKVGIECGSLKEETDLLTHIIEVVEEMQGLMKKPVLQEWVNSLTLMQQSVLITAVRGPDGIAKDHISKLLICWLRRCFLISAFDGKAVDNPAYPGGGSFTGPSLPENVESWEIGMNSLVDKYLKTVDELPHHFQLHFMHAAEILGYKHTNKRIRDWWHAIYLRLVNDLHLMPEPEERMDWRLGDKESQWRAAEEVIANKP